MNMLKEKKMTKVQLSITLILILFFSITGATYAFYAVTDTNDGTITGDMATVNLTLDVDKIFPASNSDNTGVIVPQLSVSGDSDSPLDTALKSGCVDDNGNIVCQVYKVNIQNIGGTATQVVDGSIKFYGDAAMTNDVSETMPSLRWKLADLADAVTPGNSILGDEVDLVADADDNNVFANDLTMVTDSSFDYYIIIWINETDEDQPIDVGSSFYAEIRFDSANGTGVTATFSS